MEKITTFQKKVSKKEPFRFVLIVLGYIMCTSYNTGEHKMTEIHITVVPEATRTITGQIIMPIGIGLPKEEKVDITKPKNTKDEIKVITEALFNGEELELFSAVKIWANRGYPQRFPSFHLHDYRIKQEIPEGYEEVAYRFPKRGEEILYTDGSVGTAAFDFKEQRLIILKKKAPKFAVGQIWEGKYGSSHTLQITRIEDGKIYHLDSRYGVFEKEDVVSADSTDWNLYQLREV